MRILGVDPGLDGGLAIVEDGALVWAERIPWEAEPITPVGGVRGKALRRLYLNTAWSPFDSVWIEHPLLKSGSNTGNPLTFAHFGMIVEAFRKTHQVPSYVYPGGIHQPHCWQAWAFAGLKRQIQTNAYADLGLPAAGLKDETLWFTRLACLIYFGREAGEHWLTAPKRGAKTARSGVLHDGLCDAALVAFYGWATAIKTERHGPATTYRDVRLQIAWPEFFQARAEPLPPSDSDVPFPEDA